MCAGTGTGTATLPSPSELAATTFAVQAPRWQQHSQRHFLHAPSENFQHCPATGMCPTKISGSVVITGGFNSFAALCPLATVEGRADTANVTWQTRQLTSVAIPAFAL